MKYLEGLLNSWSNTEVSFYTIHVPVVIDLSAEPSRRILSLTYNGWHRSMEVWRQFLATDETSSRLSEFPFFSPLPFGYITLRFATHSSSVRKMFTSGCSGWVWVRACVCLYMFVCMYVYLDLCVLLREFACICMCHCVYNYYVCVYVHFCLNMFVRMCTWLYECTCCECVRVCICMCMWIWVFLSMPMWSCIRVLIIGALLNSNAALGQRVIVSTERS